MIKAGVILTSVMVAAALIGLALVIPRQKSIVSEKDLKKLFRPQLGTSIPTDVRFRDESGKEVVMGDYGRDRPYILVPVYYKCPSLCDIRMRELVDGLSGIAALSVGKDYDVVIVSFDPNELPELASAKKQSVVDAYGRPESESGWHFLTGEQDQIDALLDSIGYRVKWDDDKKEYLHASGIVICSPDGVIIRYFPGLDYRPLYLRLALLEASDGTIRLGVIDQVLLPCFRFDKSKGRYSASVLTLVKAGSVMMVGLIGLFWLRSWLLPQRVVRSAAETGEQNEDLAGASG